MRFLRFALVGGGFAAGYAVLTALLVGWGWPAYATSVGLYALCIPLAFLAQRHVTFGLSRTRTTGFPIYAATQLVSLALVSTLTTRFVTQDPLLDTGIFLLSAGLAAVLSYAVSSRFAFRRPIEDR